MNLAGKLKSQIKCATTGFYDYITLFITVIETCGGAFYLWFEFSRQTHSELFIPMNLGLARMPIYFPSQCYYHLNYTGLIISGIECLILKAWKPHWRERFSTVVLRELNSLDQFIYILNILFTFFTKTSYLNEEVNYTEPSPSVSVPCLRY
jgi:hypothetical protein